MKMFCKHKWKLLSETKSDSKLEVAYSCGVTIRSGADKSILERELVQVLACERCGKLKKFVEVL